MNKYTKKVLLIILPFTFLSIILYFMFKDSYQDIILQLKRTNPIYFFIMILIGILYEILDAAITYYLIKPKVQKLTFLEMVQLIFLGVFMNITTYGTGIKPAQTFYLGRKNVDYGRAFSMLTMPYIYHKSSIIIYASVMLLLQNSFFYRNYFDIYGYLFSGYILSIIVIVFLILVCASKYFSKFICYLLDKGLKKQSWMHKKEKIENSIHCLYIESNIILKNKKTWCLMIFFNVIKLSCWFILPVFAMLGVKGSIDGASVIQIVAITSLMQLLIGVIPTAGGMVSTEVVYVLLFSRIMDDMVVGATLILYRLATYYLPFLISVPLLFTMKNFKKEVSSKNT